MTDLESLRLAFARAIVRPGGNALRLTPENTGDGWVPIEDAVASDRPYAVEVADDVFAVDADSLALRELTMRLVAQLRMASLRPVLVESGRPDHLHAFARSSDRLLLEAVAAEARMLGLNVARTIRPPLAPHRSGLPVRLLEPANPMEALASLSAAAPDRLSHGMATLLREGDVAGRYRSRSELEQGLALATAQAGWTAEWFFRAMSKPSNLGGAKVQEDLKRHGERAARRRLARAWRKAEERLVGHPPIASRDEARREICRLDRAADLIGWPGMAGATDRVVLKAHTSIALEVGTLEYGASVRQIAELAAVSTPTAHKSQGRLRGRGWLRRVGRGRGETPSRWRLTEGRHGL